MTNLTTPIAQVQDEVQATRYHDTKQGTEGNNTFFFESEFIFCNVYNMAQGQSCTLHINAKASMARRIETAEG
jgi:hypothetical protein